MKAKTEPVRMKPGTYARARGVFPEAIRYQIRQGVIKLNAEGTLSVAQADAAWGTMRTARAEDHFAAEERQSKMATAKVADAVAKARLEQHRLEQAQGKLVERAAAEGQMIGEINRFLTAMRSASETEADVLANYLGCERAVAADILGKLMALTLDDEMPDPAAEVKEALDTVARRGRSGA